MIEETGLRLLKEEANRFEEKGYLWLTSQKYPITFSRECDDHEYKFEVDLLEKNDEYTHIAVMVSYDEKTDTFPPSESIIVRKSS